MTRKGRALQMLELQPVWAWPLPPGSGLWVAAEGPLLPAVDGLRTAAGFAAAVNQGKQDLRGLVPRLVVRVREILDLRQALLVHPTPYRGLHAEVAALITPRFLRDVPYSQLGHVVRYLQARRVRPDRWSQNPAKDDERAKEIAAYERAILTIVNRPGAAELRWLLEELRVSVFAQHLGTAMPVSPKKLDQAIERVQGRATPGESPVAAAAPDKPRPLAVTPLPGKTKQKPLKNLNALGGLFGPRS